MTRAKNAALDRFDGSPPATPEAEGIKTCAAHGCPLPGTLRTAVNAGAVCSCHYGAKATGWQRATRITRRHESLWRAARGASCAGLPEGASEDLAKALFAAAKAEGLAFNDAQREDYARAGMKLRKAGQIVEAAIVEAAVSESNMGSDEGPTSTAGVSALELAIRHLALPREAACA